MHHFTKTIVFFNLYAQKGFRIEQRHLLQNYKNQKSYTKFVVQSRTGHFFKEQVQMCQAVAQRGRPYCGTYHSGLKMEKQYNK